MPTIARNKNHFMVEPQFVISHPDDAQRLSRAHVQKHVGGVFAVYDSVLSTTNNDAWQRQRDLLSVAFLPGAVLSQVLPVSLARARYGGERLAALAEAGPVDMSDFLLHEAMAQLQLALLGSTEEDMEVTNAPVRAVFGRKPTAKVGDLNKAMQQLLQHLRNDRTLSMPGENHTNAIHGPVGRALQIMDVEERADFTPGTVPGNLLLLLFAGHDTTGHTMTWMLHELGRHPDMMMELVAEVDAFWARLGGRDPTYADLAQLPFMDLCVTETLRLWPAVANGTTRVLMSDEHVRGPGGKDVLLRRGTAVLIMNWQRHRSKELWGPDADSFNPRRDFSQGEVSHVGCPMAARNPESQRFSPFAHNPRSCLGKNFAMMEIRLIMTQLLRQFLFEPTAPYDSIGDVPADAMDPEGFVGINLATLGPKKMEDGPAGERNPRPIVGLTMFVRPRA
eukprot:NODE_5537_length_1759_cov_11.854779.p1 GENE.NODE_5537_length_1759_cov_11.854779~~NODE_5537_length_1759_cov_11.854779.p1  ORF type:complete len:515 (-),score=127.13 NODE_5537_length_1759_cov_11.854779:214-1560(-)